MNRTSLTIAAALLAAGCASFDAPPATRAQPREYTTITSPEDLAWARAVAASLHTPAMEAAIAQVQAGLLRERGR